MKPKTKKFPESAYVRDPKFLKLQFKFAIKASQILKIPLTDALKNYTEIKFLLKRKEITPQLENKLIKVFIGDNSSNTSTQNLDIITKKLIDFIKKHQTQQNHYRENCVESMGVNIDETERTVQWHTIPFPVNSTTPSIFKKSELNKRKDELKIITEFIHSKYQGKVDTVFTYSWLFNLDSVKRIFPNKFAQSGEVVNQGYRGLANWGQFIDKSYQLKKDISDEFIKNLSNSTDEKSLFESFPYPVVKLESNIDVFYNEFLG